MCKDGIKMYDGFFSKFSNIQDGKYVIDSQIKEYDGFLFIIVLWGWKTHK